MTKWPKCEWCNTLSGVFRCSYCWHFTCGECLQIVNDTCQHEKYVPIEGDNWKGLTPQEYKKLHENEWVPE